MRWGEETEYIYFSSAEKKITASLLPVTNLLLHLDGAVTGQWREQSLKHRAYQAIRSNPFLNICCINKNVRAFSIVHIPLYRLIYIFPSVYKSLTHSSAKQRTKPLTKKSWQKTKFKFTEIDAVQRVARESPSCKLVPSIIRWQGISWLRLAPGLYQASQVASVLKTGSVFNILFLQKIKPCVGSTNPSRASGISFWTVQYRVSG